MLFCFEQIKGRYSKSPTPTRAIPLMLIQKVTFPPQAEGPDTLWC